MTKHIKKINKFWKKQIASKLIKTNFTRDSIVNSKNKIILPIRFLRSIAILTYLFCLLLKSVVSFEINISFVSLAMRTDQMIDM